VPGHRIAGNRDGNAGARLRRPSIVVALALGVVLAGLGESASAAVTGLERVSASSPSNSSNKSVTISCPAGKRVVGAGGDLNNALGQVTLGFVRPDAALSSVTVRGRENENGAANDWFVRAVAICATPPPGLVRVTAASPSNSANKSVTATCPAGKRLLGTGAEIDGGGGQAAPNDVIPGSSLKAVTVHGLEDGNGTGVNWRARAYAICANPVAGLERAVAASPTDSSSSKGATATCPAAKQVTGAGAELGGGGGEVVLDDLTPQGGLGGVAVLGLEDENGTSANWFTRAFAICAAASERIVAASPTSSSNKQVFASCPAGKQVTGGGGDITGGGGQVLIDGLVPEAARFGAFGAEDETGTTSDWLLRAYAICATPLPGLEVVSNESPFDSSSSKNASADCPAGKRVVGAGAVVVGGQGQVALDDVVASADLSGVGAVGIEDESGYANNWIVRAHAVCANPPPGLELVVARSDPDSDPGSVTASCPSGENLLGTGAAIASGDGEVVLDDVRPNGALTSVTVTGFEDETGLGSEWTLIAQAICANP